MGGGRLNWFLCGSLVGSLQVLNQVYEHEVLQESVKEELASLKRLQDNVSFLLFNQDV